jgi:hypothetical protein
MTSGVRSSGRVRGKAPGALPRESKTPSEEESHEESNRELLELLGEVIRMSQAWARALESGDPFTADKYEADCVRAMERFEAKRRRNRAKAESFEQTQ